MCVFRERRPTFLWGRMVLAAPAMVVPALVVAAEARAGHAATLLVAAKALHATLLGVPAPVLALAPRFTLTMCPEPERKSSHCSTNPVYTSWIISIVTCLHCLCVFPTLPPIFFVAVFIFHFYRWDKSSLCSWPCLTLSSLFPSHQHCFSANHLCPFSLLFFDLSLYVFAFFGFFKHILLSLTFLCVSL